MAQEGEDTLTVATESDGWGFDIEIATPRGYLETLSPCGAYKTAGEAMAAAERIYHAIVGVL